MKTTLILLLVALSSFSAVAQDAKPGVKSLNWISGCWETSSSGSVTIERWGKATDNLILGTSQTMKGTKSVAFEFLRIVDNGHGLMYVAQPSDAKAPTAFAAIKTTEKEVVFENAKHDFPQRIIYRLKDRDSLFARIEGKQGEKEMGIDFLMKRVNCD